MITTWLLKLVILRVVDMPKKVRIDNTCHPQYDPGSVKLIIYYIVKYTNFKLNLIFKVGLYFIEK